MGMARRKGKYNAIFWNRCRLITVVWRNKMKKFFLILKYAKVKKIYISAILLLAALSSYLEVTPTTLLGKASDKLISVMGGTKELGEDIILLISSFAVMVVLGGIVRNLFCYLTSRYSNMIIYCLRKECFNKLLNINYDYLNFNEKSSVLNTIYNHTGRLEMVFSTALFTLVSDIFDLIMISIYIVTIDPVIIVILALFIPIKYIIGIRSSKVQKNIALEKIRYEERMISVINETYDVISTIKIFSGKNRANKDMNLYNRQYYNKCNEADLKLSSFFVVEKALRIIGKTMALIYISANILKGYNSVGTFMVVAFYADKFYSPLTNITRYFQMIQNGMASIDKIIEFIKVPNEISKDNITFEESKEMKLRCKNISIYANDNCIIKNISCEFNSGMLNIVTGESGSGKSSLIKAILGIYNIKSGNIFINEIYKSVEPLFSFASQDVAIFNESIIDNCLYPLDSETASEEQLIEARKLLRLFLFEEKKILEFAGEGGTNLSGGEKKRIAFIRAIISKAPILILDEITSNLDIDNIRKMEDIIIKETKNRLVVLVTHDWQGFINKVRLNQIQIIKHTGGL